MKYIATSVVAMLLLSGCDNTQSNNSSPSETEVGVVTLKSQPVSVVSELTGRTSAALSARRLSLEKNPFFFTKTHPPVWSLLWIQVWSSPLLFGC